MDWLNFISNILGSLAWPAVLVIVLLIFRGPIKNVISSLEFLRYKDFEMGFGEHKEKEINIITSHHQRSCHSFRWFRDNTELQYSDKQFRTIMATYPKILGPINIVSRNEKKRKKGHGHPGMRLKREYRQEIEKVLHSSV